MILTNYKLYILASLSKSDLLSLLKIQVPFESNSKHNNSVLFILNDNSMSMFYILILKKHFYILV